MTAIPNRPVDGKNGDSITDNGDNTSTLRYICASCGESVSHTVPTLGLYNWIVRRNSIQKAFPELDVNTRESIIMHLCITCTNKVWDNLIGEDD